VVTHTATWLILDGQKQVNAGPDLATAEDALRRYLSAKHSAGIGKGGPRETSEILIADALTIYMRDVAPGTSRPRDVAFQCERLLKFFGGMVLVSLNAAACKAYAAQSSTNSMARRDLEVLRAAINYHRKEGLHDRIVSVWLPDAAPARERWLSRGEVAALLWRLWRRGHSQHVAKFALLALYSGRRSSVVCAASFQRKTGCSWIDTRGGMLLPPERVRKTKKRNPPIPLPRRLLAHLRRWERAGQRHAVEWGDHRSINRVDRVLREAAAEAGISGVITPHVLRHTAATWLVTAGVDLFQCSRFLGMSVQTLEKTYAHYAPEFLAEAVAAFDGNRQRLPKNGVNLKRTNQLELKR
jgi:integrase